MLTEKRQEEIIKLLDTLGSVTVQELTERFRASESTIRRDLNILHKKGVLVKVFGGAVRKEKNLNTREEKVSLRLELNKEEKIRIARYAASLIAPDDFIYTFDDDAWVRKALSRARKELDAMNARYNDPFTECYYNRLQYHRVGTFPKSPFQRMKALRTPPSREIPSASRWS